MNRLIIVGNGFDLSHGIKSRFIDFLDDYKNDVVDSFVKKFESRNLIGQNTFFEDTLLKINYQSNSPSLTEQMSEITTFKDLIQLLQTFRCLEVKSHLLQKFINKINGGENWVDIESLYFKTLYTYSENVEYDKTKIQLFNQQFEFIKNGFIEYLKVQLKQFEQIIEKPRGVDFIKDYKNVFYDGFNHSISGDKIMFLNFNYTDILKKHIERHNVKTPLVNYIHGEIDEPKNPIIMGFGDEHDDKFKTWESNDNQELFRNIKSINYFKTPNYQQLYSFLNDND